MVAHHYISIESMYRVIWVVVFPDGGSKASPAVQLQSIQQTQLGNVRLFLSHPQTFPINIAATLVSRQVGSAKESERMLGCCWAIVRHIRN